MLLMKESVLSFEEKQQHNLGLPTFKWPTSTKHLFFNSKICIENVNEICFKVALSFPINKFHKQIF